MIQMARLCDREAVNALAVQAHEMHVAWRPDLYVTEAELYPVERFAEAVKQRQMYVAKIEEAVVGYARLNMQICDWPGMVKRKIMTVEEFCVHESCRGQGIGKEMMSDIRTLAAAFRCTDLQLGVYPQNDDAVGFYQKCGFTIRSIEMQQKV